MDARNPSSTYPVQVSRFLNMNMLNQAIGGYHFEADSIDGTIPFKPDLITVAYGTNDWKKHKSMDELSYKCKEYLDKLIETFPNTPVYIITPIWRAIMFNQLDTGTLLDVIEEIKRICNNYENVNIIDGLKLVPNLPKYYNDGTHPNDEGFLHYSINLCKALSGSNIFQMSLQQQSIKQSDLKS
ncbi:MAG: SGNH/GDSL hydrolase family protein [Clostridiaceae bacterium]|nr:SGNH/GDSL hydrolase family protein [Clostridiaceae bacterium]